VETFCKAAAEAYAAGVWQMDEADLRMVFHSHFSDDSRQDAFGMTPTAARNSIAVAPPFTCCRSSPPPLTSPSIAPSEPRAMGKILSTA